MPQYYRRFLSMVRNSLSGEIVIVSVLSQFERESVAKAFDVKYLSYIRHLITQRRNERNEKQRVIRKE